MLRAEELMIGDYVMYQGNPNKVERILPNTIPFADKGREAEDLVHIIWKGVHKQVNVSKIQPIPLTSEILEANGFSKTYKGSNIFIIDEYSWGEEGKRNFTFVTITFYKNLNSGVRFLTKIETDCSHKNGINQLHSCDIEYVHQLQHAIRLCGIDKEIIIK